MQSRSGVFRSCNMARRKRSWSRLPVGPVLDIRRRLADFTATSARPFDSGKATEEIRCLIPHSWRKFFVLLATNSGPPSLASSSGTPKVAKQVRRWRTRPAEPPRSVPGSVAVVGSILSHVWTNQGGGRCVCACRRSPRPHV